MRAALVATGIAGLAAALTMVAGCGAPSTASQSTPSGATGSAREVTIDIHNFMFAPRPQTVKTGTKVTWVNQDPAPTKHTATADSGGFDTGSIAPGGQASFTFATRGTFQYHCNIHEFMTAEIVVSA